MKHAKPRRFRYKKTRKLRFRMRGGVGENVALRVFWTGVRDIVVEAGPWLVRGISRIAGTILQREAPVIIREGAPAAGRAAADVAAEVAAPLLTRMAQWAMATASVAATRAIPAVLSAGPAAIAALAAMRPSIGRAIAVNPARARNIIGMIFDGLRVGFNWITMRGTTAAATVVEEVANPAARGLLNAAARAAARGANPVAQEISGLVRVAGEEVAAAVRPPIPPTGPISRAVLEDLFSPEHAAQAPKRIADFFKANPEIKVPSDFLKAVKLPEKVLAQKTGFIEKLISSGRLEGSPADMLQVASKFIGEKEAERILTGIANPAAGARAAAEAAIKVIPEGSTRAQEIANYMLKGLAKTAEEEAKLIAEAAARAQPSAKGLNGIMNTFMNEFNRVFGKPPSNMDIIQKFVPSASNIGYGLRTGVTNAGIANYSAWLQGARTHFMEQMTPAARNNFMEVMTPEVMGQFRQGMMRVFAHDAALAEEIIEQFVLRVIPQIERRGSAVQLNTFLSGLRSTPSNVRTAVLDLIESLADRASRDAASLALSQARYAANLPARLMGRLAAGTLTGGVGLFAVMLQGTPNGGGLGQAGGRFAGAADAIRDRVYQWFGIQLWENPPADNSWGQQLATAGGFENVAAMTAWLATQGRQWLWSNMGSILTSIGLAGTAAFAYFKSSEPPKETPLTSEQVATGLTDLVREGVSASSSSSSSSSSTGRPRSQSLGGYKKRRTVRKYR